MNHIGLTRKEIEHLQQIITRLDARPPGPGSERRVHPRIDFAQPMEVNLPAEQGSPWIHVYSRNLSTGGLSFLTRYLFYADQHLVISHELNERSCMLVLCRVLYCRPIDLGVQEVGLTFVAAQADPGRRREIPDVWRMRVLENDWMTRRKAPVAAAK